MVVWDIENPDTLIDLPAIQEFIITVEPVNDPPIIISTPSSNGMEDVEYIYQVEVEDIDNDVFYLRHLHPPLSSVYWSFFTNENDPGGKPQT